MTSKLQDVVEIQKKELVGQKHKINYEKMRGRFKVNINKNLDMKKRIQTFSNDPVAYYLHKNRNFIRKLQPSSEDRTHMDKVHEFEENMKEYFHSQKRDQYYANHGVNPRNQTLCNLLPPFE